MKYNAKAIHEASKQRYIDLGIIHLPSKVSFTSETKITVDAKNAVNNSDMPKASTKTCVDCGNEQTIGITMLAMIDAIGLMLSLCVIVAIGRYIAS